MEKVNKIRRIWDDTKIDDIEGATLAQLMGLGEGVVHPGDSIAITAGSRGIANIHRVIKAVVGYVRQKGGNPFIIPAMGSHGGATPEGQRAVIEGYGVTEEFCGAPIYSSLEVVELPNNGLKTKVYMDKLAYNADGVIVVNRVKPHTDFHGTHESGLVKMLVIGLGKHAQAQATHHYGAFGLRDLIPPTAQYVVNSGKIRAGVGLVENALDHTAIIKACKAQDIFTADLELLDKARALMPNLPADNAHILVVDELGKDISGSGMDTNIVKRMRLEDYKDENEFAYRRIIVCGLSAGAHGNAVGIGIADFALRNILDKMDFDATYENTITSNFAMRGMLPILGDTFEQCYTWAHRCCGPVDAQGLRLMRIKNTLKMDELYVSNAIWSEICDRTDVELIQGDVALCTPQGDLTAF